MSYALMVIVGALSTSARMRRRPRAPPSSALP